MATYNFSANAVDFGNYTAASLADAMESFAKESGYTSWASMTEQAIEISGAGSIEIREVYKNGQLGPDIAPDQTAPANS